MIRLVGSKSRKITGLVLPDAAYKNQSGVTSLFDEDNIPLDEYDPSVTRDTNAWEKQKLQALCNPRLNNQDRIRTTKHGCRIFILHAFKEVHCISLRDEDTYYEMVSPLELLAHFAKEIGGLEITDVVILISKLPGYWYSNPRVPQFIITMEEAQKKAKHSGLPITENWLAPFATSSLLLANSFSNDCSEWYGKPKADQTWKAWKDTFKLLHKNLERETRLARGEDSFGAAESSQLIHGIDPTTVLAPFNRETHLIPEGGNLAKDFDKHFHHLATVATHRNKIVQGTLSQLTKSAINQHNEIKKLLAELKYALPSNGGQSNKIGGGRNILSSSQKETHDRHITQIQTSIKRK